MLFSIIIPVYNVEQYLSECLDSVLRQTFPDWEAVCVNDGSTDGSLAVLHDYALKDERIKVISQENKGLSGARNTGIAESKGDYLFFLDSDDWLADNSLEILSRHIDGQDFIAFNGKRVFESGETEPTDAGIVENALSGWAYFERYVLQSNRFAFVCVVLRLYRRTFLVENNLWFKEGIYHEDNLFTPLVCYAAQEVISIPDVLYFYRIRQGSIMTAGNVKRSRDIIAVANQLAGFFQDKPIERSNLNRYIAGLYIRDFMPENCTPSFEKELLASIDWNLCKQVCTYPRHKRLYKLLKLSPKVFRFYVSVEQGVKRLKG